MLFYDYLKEKINKGPEKLYSQLEISLNKYLGEC